MKFRKEFCRVWVLALTLASLEAYAYRIDNWQKIWFTAATGLAAGKIQGDLPTTAKSVSLVSLGTPTHKFAANFKLAQSEQFGTTFLGLGWSGFHAGNLGAFKSDESQLKLNSMAMQTYVGLEQRHSSLRVQEIVGGHYGLWHDSTYPDQKLEVLDQLGFDFMVRILAEITAQFVVGLELAATLDAVTVRTDKEMTTLVMQAGGLGLTTGFYF